MSIYDGWGFRLNPFQTTPLSPDSLGKSLLVGRDTQLAMLRRRLENPPRLPTIEGANGIGKSSLVNVAAYSSYEDFQKDPSRIMLIPCRRVFQLRPERDPEEFISDVYREVCQTLIEQSLYLEGNHIKYSTVHQRLNRWLNAPELKSFQAGAAGFGGGWSSVQNTGEGFSRSGFNNAVRDWLGDIFPSPEAGGIVCIIDNLELLQTSDAARQHLEALRDELLTVAGFRWVLCGALGIVLGVAASPRLEGHLFEPIQISGIGSEFVPFIYSSRVEAYGVSEDWYLPLELESFQHLYAVLRANLRSVLGHADDFCQWVADRYHRVASDEKRKIFDEWLAGLCKVAYDSAHDQLRPRAWRVFEDAIAIDGLFAPSDYEHFGFNSVMAFRPHVRDLEGLGLVVSTKDEGDKRRKTIQVTPKGWLVNEWQNRAR